MYKNIKLKKNQNASPEKLLHAIHTELKGFNLSSLNYNNNKVSFTSSFWFIPHWDRYFSIASSGNIQLNENSSTIEISLSFKRLIILLTVLSIAPIIMNIKRICCIDLNDLFFYLCWLFGVWVFIFNGYRYKTMRNLKAVIEQQASTFGYQIIKE